MQIFNESVSKTIVHSEGGEYYRIDPLQTAEIPDEIAESILSGWPTAKVPGKTKDNLPAVPWEHRCGDVWEKAKKEFGIKEKAMKETRGPERPEVVEPEIPADAVDPDSGRIQKDKLNKNVCPTCAAEFPTLKGCRLHQRKKHLS